MGDMADWIMQNEDVDVVEELVYIPFLKLKRETEKAWCLQMEDKTDHWFPKSQCELNIKEKEIEVPCWLAVEKGI